MTSNEADRYAALEKARQDFAAVHALLRNAPAHSTISPRNHTNSHIAINAQHVTQAANPLVSVFQHLKIAEQFAKRSHAKTCVEAVMNNSAPQEIFNYFKKSGGVSGGTIATRCEVGVDSTITIEIPFGTKKENQRVENSRD